MEQPNVETANRDFTCLIADDSEFARRNIAKIVAVIGGRVVGEAANGREAVELYNNLKPDLVLMDITMPELDGIETLRRIIERDRNARVIIVSSLGHKEIICKAICLGAKHFFIKPYTFHYASTVIKSVLGSGKGM